MSGGHREAGDKQSYREALPPVLSAARNGGVGMPPILSKGVLFAEFHGLIRRVGLDEGWRLTKVGAWALADLEG